MEEIAQQFREELQELLDRYKNRLTTPQIMRIAQPIFTKTIRIKDNPGCFTSFIITRNKPGNEPNAFSGPNPICRQGPDGCCATYKDGWDKCKSKGCPMYCGGKE